MIYIYTQENTPRLRYTLDVLFKTILLVDYQIVDKQLFNENIDSPRINYSDIEIANTIWIKPNSLLFEKDIKRQDIKSTFINGVPYFYKTSEQADIKYDILASSFFMLTRYEEYLSFNPDKHGRFLAKESVAYKENFLLIPVVHLWAEKLKLEVVKAFPNYEFPVKTFSQINTIDIDIAYMFKGKSFYRFFGGFLKALLSLDKQEIKARWRSLNKTKDPFDTYDTIQELQQKSKAKILFFIQVGKYGEFDKNLALNKTMKSLITKLSGFASIGIHPSYASNSSFDKLEKEHQDLSNVLGTRVTKSRQHYLKMSFPETYENLIKLGVTKDYTMGYPDYIGFRAGMATAFPFFNLETNTQRPLQITPFQVIEGALKDYMALSPKEAKLLIGEIKKSIKEVDATFVSIFHNSSLTDKGEWQGWLDVYEDVVL